jgi:DNA-binding MarR family transcriptional regulator
MSKDEVLEVQRLYPQIYVACHTDHIRAVSTAWRISSQDASILVHLDRETGLSPRRLASHLGVAPSTLSAAIARLSELGYITSTPTGNDRRRRFTWRPYEISEAIREGSKLRPQCIGYFYHLIGDTIHSCVIGAAFEAAGLYNPEQLKMPCHLDDRAYLFDGIPEDWATKGQRYRCPDGCNQKHPVPALAAHLNDHQGWKRERIAYTSNFHSHSP